ncbi:unnamed protein product [Caretta caretta]
MADRSEGAELTLTSGEEECEMRVCDTDGEPRGHVAEPTGDVYLARLRTRPQALSMETLQGARDGLERRGELGEELGSCLDLALERFCREPLCVQENARMLVRWDGGELEFVSGQGQCEISVSCSAGEPQYHITEKTWDVFVAWTHSHPEPLSISNLERVRNTLESWGALGEELSGCFGEAISQFSREPPCVQENARTWLCWDGGSLAFLSGEGQYVFSVSYEEGNPCYHFHVDDLPGHLYVARLRSRKDLLSADSLFKFHTELGLCWGDTAALRACLLKAWEGFRREPRCVQENARLLVQWGREKLEFVSGKGQCEISVLLADGRPQYHITELGGDRPVTWSHASPEPLSVADLARVRDRLGWWQGLSEELSSSFGEAIARFSREPLSIQGNTRLLIRWGGGELEFVSGQGQCEISVLLTNGEPQYHITELGGDRPVTWVQCSPEPLSTQNLVRVQDRLGHWGVLGKEASGCFGEAISRFSREPRCVKGNARMGISWDGGSLQFLSGEGQCEISVCSRDGRPHYEVVGLPVHMYLARLRAHPEPLSADTLRSVWDKLGSCKGDRDNLRACFHHAWEGFSREPPSVQDNARLLIRWGRRQVRFTSGKGECEITMSYEDGKPQ